MRPARPAPSAPTGEAGAGEGAAPPLEVVPEPVGRPSRKAPAEPRAAPGGRREPRLSAGTDEAPDPGFPAGPEPEAQAPPPRGRARRRRRQLQPAGERALASPGERALVRRPGEESRLPVTVRRRSAFVRYGLPIVAGLLLVAGVAAGGFWIDRGGLERLGLGGGGIGGALAPAGSETFTLMPADGWITLMRNAADGGEAVVAADAPFRLRVDGTVYTIAEERAVGVPLSGASEVEARAIDTPVDLTLTRLAARPDADG